MTAADPFAARRNQIPRGILYMVLSTVMFAGVNAIIKWEVALYPIGLRAPGSCASARFSRSPTRC